MISFKPMGAHEYPAYLDYFIPDYAAEIAANYGLTATEATAQATREIARDLPLGVETEGEVMLCILSRTEEAESLVGYFWYRPDTEARSVFIKDFCILGDYRDKGFGKQALKALETDLGKAGFEQIRLRVAGDNGRARHVYEATGFRVTGINMSKAIMTEG